jgi:hypothetical protein
MEIYPWNDFAGLVIMSVIFVGIMAIVYKWMDIRKLYAKITVSYPVDTF